MAGAASIAITINGWRCASCDAPTIERGWVRVSHMGSGTERGVPAQLKRAGVKFSGGGFQAGTLCEDCAKAARSCFVCGLCKQECTSDLLHDQWGADEPRDSVCEPCYETTPAKQWDAFVESMEKAHRWDYD